MNAESSRLRSTGKTSSDIGAIWPGALLVVYLGATGALLVFASDRVRGASLLLHLVLLALVGAATWVDSAPRWMRSWMPLVALPFLYAEMPVLIQAAGHARPFDAIVRGWEQFLFAGQPSVSMAARWPSLLLSEVMHAAYLSYYGIIVALPLALYLARRRAEFSESVFVLMVAFLSCCCVYIAFPVAGPRYLAATSHPESQGLIRVATVWILETGSSRGTAFPSSHVAVAVVQTLLAFRYFGVRTLPVLSALLTAGIAVGAVYGGFHYAIDVIAGVAFGAVTFVVGLSVAYRGTERRGETYAKASAPT